MAVIRYLLSKLLPIYYPKEINSPIWYSLRSFCKGAIEIFGQFCKTEMENALTSEGYNPIIYAAVVKNFEAVNYLSIAGFNINSCDYDGRSLLLHCLMHEQYFLADRLIERGANINL